MFEDAAPAKSGMLSRWNHGDGPMPHHRLMGWLRVRNTVAPYAHQRFSL